MDEHSRIKQIAQGISTEFLEQRVKELNTLADEYKRQAKQYSHFAEVFEEELMKRDDGV